MAPFLLFQEYNRPPIADFAGDESRIHQGDAVTALMCGPFLPRMIVDIA